jgi:transitional endoplasmic reticulum ATPase
MKPRKGIFLVSPPGWGKTLLAKALANECGLNFIPVKGTDVRVCWVGESARNLKTFFEIAKRHAPALLFLDEIDSMLPYRGTGIGGVRVDEQMVAAFNEELDGIVALENVIVLAATNRPDLVDPAVIRRLTGGTEPIWLPLLDHADRIECFKIYTRNAPLAEDVNFNHLAELTGPRKKAISYQDKTIIAYYTFSGNEIRGICEEALRCAAKEFLTKFDGDEEKADERAEECFIHQSHFLEVIARKLEEDVKELKAAEERLKANDAREVTEPDKDFSTLTHAADDFLGDREKNSEIPKSEPELDLDLDNDK